MIGESLFIVHVKSYYNKLVIVKYSYFYTFTPLIINADNVSRKKF